MIYTFGRTKIYNDGIKNSLNDDLFRKLGARDPSPTFPNGYPGGAVWRTRDGAQAYVDSLPNDWSPSDWNSDDFSVFGVLADWDGDTAQIEDAPWRNLLRDSVVVILDVEAPTK